MTSSLFNRILGLVCVLSIVLMVFQSRFFDYFSDVHHCMQHVNLDHLAPKSSDEMPRLALQAKDESPCPDNALDIRVTTSYRLQYVPDCNGTARAHLQRVNSTWLPSLKFGDPCLKQLILRYCTDALPVPNVIHYVWFGPRKFEMYHLLSFLSVKFQAPCLVLVHSDVLPSGPLWEYFLQQQQHVLHVQRSRPRSIRGNRITKVEHQADIARLEAVMAYGGIYMDTDTVLLRSLESFRFSQMTLSYEHPGSLSNALIIAAPNASFLHLWLDTYKTFKSTEWAEHSVVMSAQLAVKHPHLINTVFQKFIGPGWPKVYIYHNGNYNWSSDFAMHLYPRHNRKYVYNVSSVLWINNAVASGARHVLYGRTNLCPQRTSLENNTRV